MIRYFTGTATRGAEAVAFERGIGLMVQPKNAASYADLVTRYPFWAADNGAFTKDPAGFSEERFLAMLKLVKLQDHAEGCVFVVAPDCLRVLASGVVIGDAAGTIRQFPAWALTIRAAGFRVAFVAQDGLESLLDDVPWALLDVLFIGGSDEWKLSDEARCCAVEAKSHGKLVHMGRVNSFKRIKRACEMLCDSADGTFLLFGPDQNLPRMLKWWTRAKHGLQAHLPMLLLELRSH